VFLAANLTMFAMFTNPRVEAMTADKVKADTQNVTSVNARNRADYQRALDAAQAEVLYDIDGRPVEKKLPAPPTELKPADAGTLANQARIEYYKALSLRISSDLADSAGIIFIALFLALMANACFIEELLAAYSTEREF
jgi:hypothetical protein